MDDMPLLPLIMRWMHILAACIAIGGPFFVRFALLPVASLTLDAEVHERLSQRVNRVWSRIVYLVIVLFLVSGIYNYVTIIKGWGGRMPWPLGHFRADYEAVFGLKIVLALWVFFLASALSGRSGVFAGIRRKARLWLSVLIVSLLVILMLSSTLRSLRDKALVSATVPVK